MAACRTAVHAVAAARRAGLLQACHDISDGGLVTAVAEMAIGGNLGARLDLSAVPAALAGAAAAAPDLARGYGETPGRFVCAVRVEDADRFAALLAAEDTPPTWAWIGSVVAAPELEIVGVDGRAERVAVARLAAAWRGMTTEETR